MTPKDPFLPVDNEARALTRQLIASATFAALATLRPAEDTPLPSVTRIALATDTRSQPVSLISSLAGHTRTLEENSGCALLIGEPGTKGDPLTGPRLTLHCTAQFIDRNTDAHGELRARYLSLRPKAGLYADFTDFRFVRFAVSDGLLNAGFGKAYQLTTGDF